MAYNTYKELFVARFKVNRYTCEQLRSYTTELGNDSNRFSFSEFKEITGISVDEYDANIATYENMKYQDLVNNGFIS